MGDIDRSAEWDRAFGSGRKGGPAPVKNTEWLHQKRVCVWLKQVHPKVRFHSSLDGLAIIGAVFGAILRAIQWSEAGYPDLIIHEARGPYTMLAIELKKEGIKIGKGEHTSRQESWLEYLRKQGAKAEFCIGSDEAKQLITNYLNGKA